MTRHLTLPLALLLFILSVGCKKSSTDNCAQIPQVKITGAKKSYFVGDTIKLGTNMTPLGLYSWRTTNSLNEISNTDGVFIPSCTKYDEGWYYLVVSYPDCATHFDSVYISVINKAATAPCTPTNNTVTFSAIPDITFGSCNWGLDPSWNRMDLSANTSYGYPDFNIYFNPYWNNKDPEDGAYNISPSIAFDQNDLYTVFISSTYESVYFQSGTGQVYVSHVGGKLRVTFCSVSFSGDLGGPSNTITASGMLTAP